MAFHLYSVLVVAIVAACVINCYAITEEQKAAIKEKLTANALACGAQHNISLEQVKQWKKERNSPDDSNKCFFACMLRKSGLLDDQGLYSESTTLEKVKPYVSDARKDEVTASIKTCSAVNDKPVGDGNSGCDRAVLIINCFYEQKELMTLLGIALD